MEVDVFDLPDYEMTQSQQEWLWLFSLVVAGKNAEFAAKKVTNYLFVPPQGVTTPFDVIRQDLARGVLRVRLEAVRTGNYTKMERAFSYSAMRLQVHAPDLSVRDLEACPGCGPKTSRFFYMMTRRGARCAALDTHVLKFLRDQGHEDVPASTPPAGPAYRRLERAFLDECDARGREPAEFDLEIWKAYRKGDKVT
jgi:hypothetical protein